MSDKKLTVLDVIGAKKGLRKLALVTAYDYPFARLADQAGVDIILVSDALGMVGLGYKTTAPVTMTEMLHHAKAVVRGVQRSLVVATLPFMSYEASPSQAVENAGRLVKEAGVDGVEVEGGPELLNIVEAILDVGIPVIPHIGLTRKHLLRFGTFKAQAKTASEAFKLFELARNLEKLEAPAVLLECVPPIVAKTITEALTIPTIGIGAGPGCDGQALVSQDMLGLFESFTPRFVKRYLDLSDEVRKAYEHFRKDVESGTFPSTEHCFGMDAEESGKFKKLIQERK